MMSSDVMTRQIQGLRGANYYRDFLTQHGKGDYRIYVDADPFARVDVLQVAPDGQQSHVELKSRSVTIDQYPDCIVEAFKIGHLQAIHQETGERTLLVALYPRSNKIAMWVIREDDEYVIVNKHCNDITIQIGQANKVPKTMVSLPMSEAKIYDYNFN